MSDGFAYDLLDYPSHVHPQMHPSRLAAIGRLHGIDAASPRDCRLLEVGCGDAVQLLSLAAEYPHSRFVGVDMSAKAIARGEAMRARLGLDNLSLHAADLTTWDPGDLPFDYILAHGFYSWVPGFVREHLLALCDQRLAPGGIAYVSYNALPGCHLRRMLWDMLKFHANRLPSPAERVEAAGEFLQWLGKDAITSRNGSYLEAIRWEAENACDRTDTSVLFHDDLAECNEPFSITDFMRDASRHRLAFLGEADYYETNPGVLSRDAAERLRAFAGDDPVVRDQYLDFLKGRRFRQTLLCRASAAMQRDPLPGAAAGLEACGQIRARTDEVDLAAGVAVQFVGPDSAAITTDHPVAKAALAIVGARFPEVIPYARLLADARTAAASTEPLEEDAAVLNRVLVGAFGFGLATLSCDAPRFANMAGERPRLGALPALLLEDDAELLISLRPSMVRLDSLLTRQLVALLDGNRDRAAILRDLAQRMSAMPVPQDEGGEPILRDAAWWERELAPKLEEGLQQTARMGLLVAAD